jgi:hypothetical protein
MKVARYIDDQELLRDEHLVLVEFRMDFEHTTHSDPSQIHSYSHPYRAIGPGRQIDGHDHDRAVLDTRDP